ncbi:hypothetical protein RRG08_040561 [Elysia crispata]|uniref:Uncharacterized protein n=1 Tax=Elysia crispata TaxID=231223 RepID=A0AAE0Z891_9GAST|nr:hypothetical protein RRG08_040561 [Elysia crispata]
MPPKRELSQEQVQEIRSLRGQLPAAEAKKRFGIGTTRLYKIWRSCPRHEVASPLPVVLRAPPLATASPLAKAPDAGGSRVEPTVVDFYNRLDRLEAWSKLRICWCRRWHNYRKTTTPIFSKSFLPTSNKR